jgi:hypothetical protein
MSRDDKICVSCGRRMAWRKKWAAVWDEVRYCSDACRTRRVRPVDRELEAAIRALLVSRPAASSICPSEAARAVAPDLWRPLMEPARAAARRLAAQGEVEIIQRGSVVDPTAARGPIRVRRARQ